MYRIIVLFLVTVSFPVFAESIKKCQDADGNWHYGDQAAAECEQTKITVIDASGEQVEEIDVPESQEELDAKMEMEEKLAEQQEVKKAQQALDQRLLVTYENEESIVRTRDALMAAIDSAIQADEAMQKRLINALEVEQNTENAADLNAQIEAFSKSIRDRLASKESARAKYQLDLNRYRELTKPIE